MSEPHEHELRKGKQPDRSHRSVSAGDAWLVFSATQRADAVTRGTLTAEQVDAIERSVAAESTLRYDRDGVRIYEVNDAA